jgi:hypothetical protein
MVNNETACKKTVYAHSQQEILLSFLEGKSRRMNGLEERYEEIDGS